MVCFFLSNILSTSSDIGLWPWLDVCDTCIDALVEALVSGNSALTLLEPASA